VVFLLIISAGMGYGFPRGEEETALEKIDWIQRKPTLTLQLGTYFPTTKTTVRVDSERLGKGTEFDLEDVFQFDRAPTVVRGDGEIRLSSWFSLAVGVYAVNRKKSFRLNEQIQIGDTVFDLDQDIAAKFNTLYLALAMKFSVVRKPTFEFGPWLGANVLFSDLQVDAVGTVTGQNEKKEVWAPIPSIGLFLTYVPLPRLYLQARAGYFYFRISDSLKFQSGQFLVRADYYFYKSLGLGASYEYNIFKLNLDRPALSGLIRSRFNGLQVYLALGF
jgi:hypothetical protein